MGRFRVLQKRLKHRRVKTKWKKALPLSDGSEVNGLKSAKTFTHRSENVSKMKQIEPPKVDPEEKAIKGLEKRLGMKKYKKKELPTEFKMDGLDYVMNFLEDSDSNEDEPKQTGSTRTLQQEMPPVESGKHCKRKRVHFDVTSESSISSAESSKICKSKHVHFDLPLESDINAEKGGEDITEVNESTYIPPHKRRAENIELTQLRRKIQGLINRLSEANVYSIISQLEQFYSNHSRNDVNTILTDVLLKATVQPVLLADKLAMEHMMIIALLHCHVGTEVGAFFVQELANMFNALYNTPPNYGPGKQCDCVLLLFAQLYNFKVIHCVLIYDLIHKLLEHFTERDIELLLVLLKNCGMEIRKDDANSLKDIIRQIQAKASNETPTHSSRVKFMLDTIAAIRTNNVNKIPNYDPSLLNHMRKLMRGLARTPGTVMNESTQLKIPLKDLLEADKHGRWWIVGSAWSGRQIDNESSDKAGVREVEMLELARQQRMNTDIRKNIFCLLMTSEDYVDAFSKLIGLHLTSVQEREIVHVLMDCCMQESTFNMYYVHLGQKFCEFQRSHQVTFQYAIWDKLKIMDTLTSIQCNNLCQFLVHMIGNGAMSIAVLRVVEFSELNETEMSFYKNLFCSLLEKLSVEKSRIVFAPVAQSHLKQFGSTILMFIKQYLMDKRTSNYHIIKQHYEIIEQFLKSSI